MSRPRAAAAAAVARRAPVAPRTPRRVSGPARPVPVPGRPRPSTPAVVDRAPTLGARVRGLPDHRLLDALLRSRAWIWLLGIALGGIVFMQVSLLGMNAGIGRAVAQGTALEHQNYALEEQVAELSSGDRIRAAAEKLGLLSPDAGSVAFVGVRPGVDARRAADQMTAPSDQARQTLATDGRATVQPVVPAVAPAAPTDPTPAATAVPTAPVAAAVIPAATVAPVTAAPAPAGTTTTTTTSATTPGAAAAP